MSFILLGALGLTAFTSWTYANTQFAWMQNADGTSGASDEGELKNVKKLRSQCFGCQPYNLHHTSCNYCSTIF